MTRGGVIFRFLIIPLIFFIGALSVAGIYMKGLGGSTSDNLLFIQNHINSQGRLVDLQREISVDSSEDIKFYYTDKKVKIEFGEVLLKWDTEEFMTKNTRSELKKIGLIVKINSKTGKVHLFYGNDEVERWVS